MTQIQTGIAVTIAIVVVAIFFLFPGLSPFRSMSQATDTSQEAAVATSTNPNEIQMTDEVVGTGQTAEPGDTLTVNYVGQLADGTIFDASANHGQPFPFVLGTGMVIQGWDKGLVGMKEGGKRKLVIPPELGYGAQGFAGVIPPNATLTFEVELVKIDKKK